MVKNLTFKDKSIGSDPSDLILTNKPIENSLYNHKNKLKNEVAISSHYESQKIAPSSSGNISKFEAVKGKLLDYSTASPNKRAIQKQTLSKSRLSKSITHANPSKFASLKEKNNSKRSMLVIFIYVDCCLLLTPK